MSNERDGDVIRYICDLCDEVVEIESEDFSEAWKEAKAQGWRCFRDKDEEWQHRCPDCRGKG